jgi:hypothetical protein
MEVLHSIYSSDRQQRVVFYANADGSIGFREERYSDEPDERCWISGLEPGSRLENLAAAIAEAACRVAWLAKDRP